MRVFEKKNVVLLLFSPHSETDDESRKNKCNNKRKI